MNKQIEEMLYKVHKGYFCQEECYGCCGDNQRDITCNTVVDNFEKELLKHYQPKIPDGAIVITTDALHEIKTDVWLDAWEKAEKRTARKFFNLSEEWGAGVAFWNNVRALAKQYGVEVDDD